MTATDWADPSQIYVADPEYLESLEPTPKKTRRGTSNGNVSGNAEDRRRRREWLLETYRADGDVIVRPATEHTVGWLQWTALGTGVKACRCYRCGELLTIETLTVDRIIPGCQGGTYRRNNIRPACSDCNEKTGGALGGKRRTRGNATRSR